MNYERMHEQISVVAEFSGAKPNVRNFTWQRKDYFVEKVTLRLKARKGREVVWIFQVATKTGAYKLRFDTDFLTWWLEEITWEE